MADESSSDDEYTVPFVGPAPYLAGLKKKKIKFVAAGTLEGTLNDAPSLSGQDIAAQYLALVMGEEKPLQQEEQVTSVCEVCKLPVPGKERAKHEASLAHQVSLSHAHPPSSVDRTRKGVAYLKSYGWDPDSRLGLGASGEGIRHPIQAKEKKDKAGLGDTSRDIKPRDMGNKVQKVPEGLTPKDIKKLEAQKKRRDRKLHDMFYTDERVAKYLGEDA